MTRIDWTENAPSRPRDNNQGAVRQWLDASDENGNLRDLSQNRAQLLFEGEQKARAFRKWSSKGISPSLSSGFSLDAFPPPHGPN